MITKEDGESIAFTGGNELTPIVTIRKAWKAPGNHRDSSEKILSIVQENDEVWLSLGTLKAILKWAESK